MDEPEKVMWRDYRVAYAGGTPDDLVLRLLIRNLRGAFIDLDPVDVADILMDEANIIYRDYPKTDQSDAP